MKFLRRAAFVIWFVVAVLFWFVKGLAFADAPPATATNVPLIPGDNPTVTIDVTPTGRNIAAIRFNGLNAVVALPANDASPGTTMSIVGAASRQPGSDSIETLSLTFSRDVTFTGYPSFRLEAPYGVNTDGLFQLELFDGSASVPLREIDPDRTSRRLTFLGGFFTPFHASAKKTYHARLVSDPPSVINVVYSDKPQAFTLPVTSGITGSLDLPGTASGAGSMTVTSSDKPPVGMPDLGHRDTVAMPFYVGLVLHNDVKFNDSITVHLVLPLTRTFYMSKYNLALYDTTQGGSGWHLLAVTPAERQGDVLRFTLRPSNLKDRLRYLGQYFFALYAIGPSVAHVAQNATEPTGAISAAATPLGQPLVVVLGDSISALTVLPQNPVGCFAGPGPTGCQYTEEPTLNYPGVLAQLTGARVQFFHQGSSQTTVDYVNATNVLLPSWLSRIPAEIPHDTDVVILEAGFQDLCGNKYDPAISSRPVVLAETIRAQAPNAKIVFIGTRECGGAEAWNAVERDLAARYGAFIDLRAIAPGGIASPQFPDGIHGSPESNREIGSAVARAIRSFTGQ